MNIVVLDGYGLNPGDLSWDEIKTLGNVTVYDRTAVDDDQEIIQRAKEADVVLTNKVPLSKTTIERLPRLRYIGVLATGYNIVDTGAAKSHGVVVTNIPSYSTESVAQMTFALILSIVNRVEHYAEENRNGRWSKSKDFCYWDTPLMELSGKTIGIVGLGNIGMRVAHIALDFQMEVFALTSKNPCDLPHGIRKTNLQGLLAISDIVTLHCPMNESTKGLISKESLDEMKTGAVLINTARGGLVDEEAVAKALSDGHLAAYGADVMLQEPPRADNPLLLQKNAFITPHIAWATKEARERLMRMAKANIEAFIDNKPQNQVN